MTSLAEWLESIGLGQYAGPFEQHAIGWDVVPHLDHSILKDIGVAAAGDRVRILKAVRALSPPEQATAEPSAPASRVTSMGDAERRHITVLFCDLVRYTELTHELDPEDLRDIISAYQGVCKAALERYGGFVARYSGDGVMAYFGYPQAHEEDAERSLRAALHIVDSLKHLNVSIADRGIELHVRIGIATGPVVVGDIIGDGASQESAVLGQTPNVATRLQALARPDTVVIAPETRHLALDYFEYRDLGEQHLKGLPHPVRAWEVLGERPTESRFSMRQMAGVTPLVGRGEEIALIMRRWDQVKEGEGQVVLLSGEPGIGKSRLAQVACERIAAETHDLVRYQCSPYHSMSSLHPIIEYIRRAAGIDTLDEAAAQLDKLKTFLQATYEDVSAIVPLFANLLSIDAGEGAYTASPLRSEALKEATLNALADQFIASSRLQPMLLIVEDAHWIDPTTENLLDLLLPAIADERILAIITYRPDYRPQWSGLAHALTLPVARLPRREVLRMIDRLLGGKPLASEVLEQITIKTDGIPLFVEELTKTIIQSGVIVETDDSYKLNGTMAELAIPATLRDSLMARLDSAASMREVAQVGATIGRQFSADLLAAVLGLDEATLNATLHQLETAGLLFRFGTPNSAKYSFKHALVQDAAYGSLLKSKRRQFHARIAEVLAESDDDTTAATPEVLAHHLMEASEFEQAALYWQQAAIHSGARYANQEAMAHCRKGLLALSNLPRNKERVRMELAFRIGLADGLRITDLHDEALVELDTAESIATEEEHLLELSQIHHMRGNIYYPLGRAATCFAEHEAAWYFAKKSGSIESEARALGGLGDGHFLAGRIHQAHKHFDSCVALARANGLLLTEVAYLPMRAVTHMYCLRFGDSLDDCDAAIDLTAKIGQARGALIARSTSSWILFDRCQFDLARQHALRGLEAVKVIGARRFIPLFNDVLARIQLQAGDREMALDLLEESWSVARESGVSFAGPVVLGALALTTTDPERRLTVLRQGEAILRSGCASHNHFRFYRDAIEASLQEKNWRAANAYADALRNCFGAESSPWSDLIAARARVLSAAASGPIDDDLVAQLRQLRDHALGAGMAVLTPQLDHALEVRDAIVSD